MSGPSLAISSRSGRRVGATLFSRRAPRYLVAVALYLLLSCVFFAPLIAHPNSRVLKGFGDATESIRDYDMMAAAGSTPYTFHHDTLNGAPEGMPVLSQTQIAQPAQSATVWVLRGITGTVAAFNIFLFTGILLTAIAGFALLDWAGFGMLPSVFGGFVMAFNPWMIERGVAGHAAFTHGWTLILLLAALTKLRAARSLRWAAIAGLAYGVCFVFSEYTGLIATSLVAAFVIVDACSQASWTERLWTGSLLVVTGGVALLFLVPALVAVALDREAVSTGLSHAAAAAQGGGARPSDYLLPLPSHPLLGFVGRTRGGNILHERVVIGFVVLGLAIATFRRLLRRRIELPGEVAHRLVVLSAVVIPIAFVASMPRTMTLLGLGIPMPSYFIGTVTTYFRAYARFGYVVEIGLAVLATAALYELVGKGRRKLPLVSVLLVVAMLEFLPGTLTTISVGRPPAYDAWLAAQPPGIAAHYPMMTDQPAADTLAASELYYQRFTRQPLFEIYGPSRSGTREDAIRLVSRYVDSPGSLGVLAAEGVRYVVIHDDVYRAEDQALPTLGPGVKLMRSFGPVRIYRLTAKPVDLTSYLNEQASTIADLFGLVRPSVTFGGGFYAPENYQTYKAPFSWMSQSGQIEIGNPESAPVRIWLQGFGFSNGVARRLGLIDSAGRTVASAEVPTSAADVRLGPITVPAGTSRFTLRASPGPAPLGPGDPRVASVFLSKMQSVREPDLTHSLRASG